VRMIRWLKVNTLLLQVLEAGTKRLEYLQHCPVDLSQLLEWCGDLCQTHDVVQWDDKLERVVAEKQKRIGALVINSRPITDINSDLRAAALINGVRRKGLSAGGRRYFLSASR